MASDPQCLLFPCDNTSMLTMDKALHTISSDQNNDDAKLNDKWWIEPKTEEKLSGSAQCSRRHNTYCECNSLINKGATRSTQMLTMRYDMTRANGKRKRQQVEFSAFKHTSACRHSTRGDAMRVHVKTNKLSPIPAPWPIVPLLFRVYTERTHRLTAQWLHLPLATCCIQFSTIYTCGRSRLAFPNFFLCDERTTDMLVMNC